MTPDTLNPSETLSPSEEITLRRVHYGLAKAGEMIARDIDRLLSIGMIVRRGPGVALTDAGRQRVRNLPGYDEQMAKLVELLARGGR